MGMVSFLPNSVHFSHTHRLKRYVRVIDYAIVVNKESKVLCRLYQSQNRGALNL
jgi:hypothetical protein